MNNNIFAMANQLKSNPIAFLNQRGINIPQNMSTDPNAIIEYLMQSGQVSQQAYDNAVKMAQQFKR